LRSRNRIIIVAAALAAFLLPVPAVVAGNQQVGNESGTRVDRLLQTKRMLGAREDYSTYCASCHGEYGAGAGGIGAFADDPVRHEDLLAAIMTGHDARTSAPWLSTIDPVRAAAIADFVEQAFILPPTAIDMAAGEAIYAKTCSVCHGEQGDGASWAHRSLFPAPIDFRSEEARQMSRQEMIAAASFGVDDTAMMPFSSQLSREDIAAVIDYVRASFVKVEDGSNSTETSHAGQLHDLGHDASATGDMDGPFPNALSGDYERGRTFYAANCAECHGANGQGNGRRAYFVRPKPRDFTSDRSRAELNREHLFAAVANGVIGREMPAWSKVIDDQQIADVAEYVFGAFVRPEVGAGTDKSAPAPAWRPATADEDAKKKN